jgi:hypothetical protein
MKKQFTTLFLSVVLFGTSIAQVVCTPYSATPAGEYYPPYDAFVCVTPGTAYSQTLSIKIPSQVTSPATADVDSVEFVAVNNLPCGLSWATNKASKRYAANEIGCIQITGTTNDAAGQYKLRVLMNAWVVGIGMVPNVSADSAGLSYYVRVQDALGNCPAVNTGAAGNTASCGVGIKEITQTIKGISVQPNPVNSSASVKFVSENSGSYTVQIIDVIGKVVNSFNTEVVEGNNSVTIETNNVPAGIYFVNITDGKVSATQKFVIAD